MKNALIIALYDSSGLLVMGVEKAVNYRNHSPPAVFLNIPRNSQGSTLSTFIQKFLVSF